MKRILFLLLLASAMCTFASGQDIKDKYTAFDGTGNPSSIEAIVNNASDVDVVFLGELHDDSVGHRLQFEIFKQIVEKYSKDRTIILSLEMFESDVQVVLDEYLSGKITEAHFLRSSRPWGNYAEDYKPLVELAKERGLKVVAANAPRRYVNMVSRLGKDSLDSLTPQARSWLPPLPFGEPSLEYAKKFNALMGRIHDETQPTSNILYSQTLWDASMAYHISESTKNVEKPLVVHLNGSFHTESRLGTPEHLMRYRPGTQFTVVTVRYDEDFKVFNKERDAGTGDFVILTDAKQPRSKM